MADKTDSEVILALQEEYDRKLEEYKKQAEEEKKQALEEQEKKHIEQIRLIMRGDNQEKNTHIDDDEDEEEQIEKRLLKKYCKKGD